MDGRYLATANTTGKTNFLFLTRAIANNRSALKNGNCFKIAFYAAINIF